MEGCRATQGGALKPFLLKKTIIKPASMMLFFYDDVIIRFIMYWHNTLFLKISLRSRLLARSLTYVHLTLILVIILIHVTVIKKS